MDSTGEDNWKKGTLSFKRAGLTLPKILSAACVETEEMERGNFLLVEKDFITTRKIEAAYQGGQRIGP